MAMLIYFMVKFGLPNFFLMFLASALSGAILGCLPGMATGGIVGLIRRRSISCAKDASPEGTGIILKAIILPLASGGGLIVFYFLVFNPWLLSVLK
jgi:hypothetical protein